MPITKPTVEEIKQFGRYLEAEGLEASDTSIPVPRRLGGESHVYFDAPRVLSDGRILDMAGRLMLLKAQEADIDFNVIAGIGSGGRALMGSMAISASDILGFTPRWVEARMDRANGQVKLSGISISTDCDVLAVQDITATSRSLLALVDAVRADKGKVEDAMVLIDRSDGEAKFGMSDAGGVRLHSIYELEEAS